MLYYSHGIDLSRRGENYTNFQGLICKKPYKLASVLLITSCTDFPVINFLKILSVPVTYFQGFLTDMPVFFFDSVFEFHTIMIMCSGI